MKKKKLSTLKRQISFLFIGLLVLAVFLIILTNGLFLERYYISRKKDSLLNAMELLENLDTGSSARSGREDQKEESGAALWGDQPQYGELTLEDEEIPEDLRKLCSKNNLNWIIITEENTVVAHVGDNTALLRDRLFGYIYQLDKEKTTAQILKKTDRYVLQIVQDRFTSMDYEEIWGLLENDNYYLIRTPLESIRESVSIANRFYIYVGILMLLISGCAILLLTARITRPISELTSLSARMKNLDFEARYSSHAGNEIDVLGENFNQMSDQLEHTILELKAANNELQRDIANKVEAEERRIEFLNNVSHELKTPIALVQGYAEGLKDNIAEDPESRDFYCDVIIDEAAKMNKLVKNLLTLNSLESGSDAPVMERFDLVPLIGGVLQSMDILIRQKEARVLFDSRQTPAYVWADEFKIEEVLTNYVSNALNHLEGDRQVEICIHKEEERVRVTVFNTGAPIPEEDIDKLWNKFYKVDKARTREYGGSGIGLSIVKAILESMRQEYGVRNYDNGVEFWFTLDRK